MSQNSTSNQSNNRLAPEDVRSETLQARATPAQKAWVEKQARKCGFKSTSDYILALCLGFEPKVVLTPEERSDLKGLIDYRADFANVLNSLHALSPDERKAHFHNFEFEHEYIRVTDLERQRAKWLFDKYNVPNNFPLNKVPQWKTNPNNKYLYNVNNKNK